MEQSGMRKFKDAAKQMFIIIVAALAVVLSSCADPAHVNPDGDAPAKSGSVRESVVLTPRPTQEPPATPEPENQWESEKSIYEIMSGNMYGWGTVAVKSNGKIYYVADYYSINVIDESGNTSELIDLEDTLSYPIYQLYVTNDGQIYFTTDIDDVERICIAAVYKIENNEAEIIYINKDHLDFVGAYNDNVYIDKNTTLLIYNLQSSLETEYEFDKDNIEIYFDAGIGCLYMLFNNENQLHLITFDMETNNIIADNNIGVYCYEDYMEGFYYQDGMSVILTAEMEDETALVKMIDLADGDIINEFSISYSTWHNLRGYYAYEDRIYLFYENYNPCGIGIYEYNFIDNVISYYQVSPLDLSLVYNIIDCEDGKVFISATYELYCHNFTTHKSTKIFSTDYDFFIRPDVTIIDNYVFISSYIGPQWGFDYPILEEILTVDSEGESERLWSRVE